MACIWSLLMIKAAAGKSFSGTLPKPLTSGVGALPVTVTGLSVALVGSLLSWAQLDGATKRVARSARLTGAIDRFGLNFAITLLSTKWQVGNQKACGGP
jgi:hypothetical protein